MLNITTDYISEAIEMSLYDIKLPILVQAILTLLLEPEPA